MLGISPLLGRSFPSHQPQHLNRQRRHVEDFKPVIRADTGLKAYTVTIQVPGPSTYLESVNARASSRASITVNGFMCSGTPGDYDYVVRQRCGLYAMPSQHELIDVLKPGTILRGAPPTNTGWIDLSGEDGEAWVIDDGSVAVIEKKKVPFHHDFDVPQDGILDQASIQQDDLCVVITIPREQPKRKQVHVSSAPRSVKAGASVLEETLPGTGQNPSAQKPASRPFNNNQMKPPLTGHDPATISRERPFQGDKGDRGQLPQNWSKTAYKDNLSGELPKSSSPLLTESPPCPGNVQSPAEDCQEWIASAQGGFMLAEAHRMSRCGRI